MRVFQLYGPLSNPTSITDCSSFIQSTSTLVIHFPHMAFRSDSTAGNKQFTSKESKEIREAKNLSEWFEKIGAIPDAINEVLESYSGLTSNEVVPHIEDVVSISYATALRLDNAADGCPASSCFRTRASFLYRPVAIPRAQSCQASLLPRDTFPSWEGSNASRCRM